MFQVFKSISHQIPQWLTQFPITFNVVMYYKLAESRTFTVSVSGTFLSTFLEVWFSGVIGGHDIPFGGWDGWV